MNNKQFDFKVYDFEILCTLYKYSDFVRKRIKEIYRYFGYDELITIHSFKNSDQLRAYLAEDVPKWVTGIALRNNTVLIINHNNLETVKTIMHEYVHIVIEHTFAAQCPKWLNEGLAMCLSQQSISAEQNPDFRGEDLYFLGYDDEAFYNQSFYIVKKMLKEYGHDDLIQRAKKCEDFINDNMFGIKKINMLKEI